MKDYKDIPGWMNYEELYDKAVSGANNGDVLVEIGAYLGKSAVYMAQKIKESGKELKFITIDPFNDPEYKELTFEKYEENTRGYDIITYVGKSDIYASRFEEESIYFLFIDGDHSEKGVRSDLENYWPKIKKGGIMAGHDLQYKSVRDGLYEWAYDKWKNCFIINK